MMISFLFPSAGMTERPNPFSFKMFISGVFILDEMMLTVKWPLIKFVLIKVPM